MNITQQQKVEYIDALRISLWYPRINLVNACAPIQLQAQSSSTVVDAKQQMKRQADDTAVESVFSPVKPMQVETGIGSLKTIESQSVSANLSKDISSVRFGLSLYVYDDWIVCSSLTSDYQAHETASAQLIQNILSTLGKSNRTLQYHHVISWPFFSNANASQGIESARLYVNGVVHHLAEEHHGTKLLICGGVLGKLNNSNTVEGNDFGLQRLIIPSIYKMLIDHKQKAKAWQIIQESKYSAILSS